MYEARKVIVIDSCQNCPYEGQCKAWKKLTKQQTARITLGVGTPNKFILTGCPLPDGVKGSEAFNKSEFNL